jgi:hypothetical protein
MNRLIVEYRDAIPVELCDKLISRFDYYFEHKGSGVNVQDKLESDGGRRIPGVRPPKEAAVIYLSSDKIADKDLAFARDVFQLRECLDQTLERYRSHTEELLGVPMSPLSARQLDFIRYQKGRGYYDAHVDAARPATQWRVVSMVAYLNDLKTGGETEFTLLGRSVTPQVGKILVFPSFYGCAHRSRLADSDTKYVVAGFVEWRDDRSVKLL